MNLYNIIDISLIIIIISLSYYFYKKRIYVKLFEYFKVFLLITISAKFASKTGLFLQTNHIISADSYAIIILIGFAINIVLFYYLYQLFLKLSNKFINNQKVKENAALVTTFFEVLIIITFTLYITMQITIIKKYSVPTLNKSISYPYIKKFYMNFLNDEFVYMVLHSDTKTNAKEIIFKSLKNSL